MSTLINKKVLVAVTGSIAAYKSVVLVRDLQKAGAEVRVIMTPSATHFVSTLTFSTLTHQPVYTDIISEDGWNSHVELGLWADCMVIAPCTANTLSGMATGRADSIVLAVYLSAKCPVYYAPAMDRDMWKHPSTTHNRNTVKAFGDKEIPVGDGFLASGLTGEGRMAEPADIVDFIRQQLISKSDLEGKSVLITAGPTREALDPVRFISNKSTGKMGIAIAEAAAARGAIVTLVLGPTTIKPTNEDIRVINVSSAEEMYQACVAAYPTNDIGIMTAAVADYRPADIATQKIKKSDDDMSIGLERTQDIAKALGSSKQAHQILIGFALETQNGIENAKKKVFKKNFDFIVLNSLTDKGAGFAGDTNKITIISAAGDQETYDLKSKTAVAQDILNYLIKNMSLT
jgi:phosphopantothenoylcysteine decarboxylase/phosphopantothenate--cysteine ligase